MKFGKVNCRSPRGGEEVVGAKIDFFWGGRGGFRSKSVQNPPAGVVTRTAGSGSQTPEMEAKHLSVGGNYRQKALEMSAKSEAEGKVLPLKEAVDSSQENKGIKKSLS